MITCRHLLGLAHRPLRHVARHLVHHAIHHGVIRRAATVVAVVCAGVPAGAPVLPITPPSAVSMPSPALPVAPHDLGSLVWMPPGAEQLPDDAPARVPIWAVPPERHSVPEPSTLGVVVVGLVGLVLVSRRRSR